MQVTPDDLQLIKNCLLFKGLDDASLHDFVHQAQLLQFKKNDPVFLENEQSQFVYFVKSGSVEIVKNDTARQRKKRLHQLNQGDHFSELSVLTSSTHSVSAFAFEDCELIALEGSRFITVLQAHPEVATNLAKTLAGTIKKNLESSHSARPFIAEQIQFDPLMPEILPIGWIKSYKVLPLTVKNKTLNVAFVLPLPTDFFAKFYKMNPNIHLQVSIIKEDEFEELLPKYTQCYLGEDNLSQKIDANEGPAYEEPLHEFLQFSLIYSQLPQSVIQQITPYMKEKHYNAGEVIFEGDEPLNEVSLIEYGEVELLKEVEDHKLYCHVETATSYDFLGVIEAITNASVSLRAAAVKKTKLYSLRKEVFNQLFKSTDFSISVCMMLASRLQALNRLPGIDLSISKEEPIAVRSSSSLAGKEETEQLLAVNEMDTEQALTDIFHKAIETNTSDIHIEQLRDKTVARYRLDGVMKQIWQPFKKELGDAFINQVKILSELDISEKRLPQDGQFSTKVKSHTFSARVSTVPTKHGEKIVLRVLREQDSIIPLAQLAQDHSVIRFLNSLIRYKQGLILVAGPTGSGKTTTLYSLLGEVDKKSHNVVTIEDPIELELDGTSQIQLHEKIGLSFDSILKAVLRQDPDIILVGEIRDAKSLELVCRAALTGHLVFASIHAPSSIDVIPRLIELGATQEQIASTLVGVISQRLVRSICPECKSQRSVTSDEVDLFNAYSPIPFNATEVSYGKGCESCSQTGYNGRVPLFEYWKKTDVIRDAMISSSNFQQLSKTIKESDFENIGQYALRMAAKGLTTVDEVERSIFGLCDFQTVTPESDSSDKNDDSLDLKDENKKNTAA